jgi:RNA polymerase sigma factor (sigma-70 family)
MTEISSGDQARLAGRVAKNRDRAAFTRLFDHFAPRINGYLQRLGMNAEAAEDLTQDVMTVLWHKAELFDPAKSSLSTWLFRVARNRRIDAARRNSSRKLDSEDPFLWPEPPEPADSQMDARQRDERVRAALKDIPEEQLSLLRDAYYLGLTQSQIAEQTKLPLGTVKSRIRLAFARLRLALDADGLKD